MEGQDTEEARLFNAVSFDGGQYLFLRCGHTLNLDPAEEPARLGRRAESWSQLRRPLWRRLISGGLRGSQRLPDCVIHSFRRTFGTRLGEAGADAFTIMRIMGHSTVTVSQKYVHPAPEAMERAFERLEALNQKSTARLPENPRRQLPATIPATVGRESEGATLEVA